MYTDNSVSERRLFCQSLVRTFVRRALLFGAPPDASLVGRFFWRNEEIHAKARRGKGAKGRRGFRLRKKKSAESAKSADHPSSRAWCIFAKKESAFRLQYEGRFGCSMKGVSVAL